ncbi:MAG: TrkH family potassium uptake protein [Nitrospinaceae bacterium]
MNFREIFNVVGILLILISALMLIPLGVALYHAFPAINGSMTESRALAWSILASGLSGSLLYGLLPKGIEKMRNPEGFLIVILSWIMAAFFGALPFYLSGLCPSFLDAYFESMSGLTTTGASILSHLDFKPPGLMFWRSMMQWLGGMGIIMLYLAIFPALGMGNLHLFRAEIPGGLTVERVKPRLAETAQLLWKTYTLLTLLETLLLRLGGMNWYDAVCHSFATLSTGGFSPHQGNVAQFGNPFVEWVIIFFMFLAGMNFLLLHQVSNKNFGRLKTHSEFRFYLRWLVLAVVLVHAARWWFQPATAPGLRDTVFAVTSLGTTTGFTTADYALWPGLTQLWLLVLMLVGGSSGSTSGSIKCIRFIILWKTIYRELVKMVYPQAIVAVKVGGEAVESDHVFNALSLTAMYIGLAGLGFILLAAMGLDWTTALSASFACLFNVGPGLGQVGPAGNFAHLPGAAKGLLTLMMVMGRLEILGFLLPFLPMTWRK